MKKIVPLIFPFIFLSCNSEKDSLEKSIWKFTDGQGILPDVLDFRKDHLFAKNDTIYINWHKKDSIIGVIDTITYHYGERRLYVKDLNGNIGRYCEQ